MKISHLHSMLQLLTKRALFGAMMYITNVVCLPFQLRGMLVALVSQLQWMISILSTRLGNCITSLPFAVFWILNGSFLFHASSANAEEVEMCATLLGFLSLCSFISFQPRKPVKNMGRTDGFRLIINMAFCGYLLAVQSCVCVCSNERSRANEDLDSCFPSCYEGVESHVSDSRDGAKA